MNKILIIGKGAMGEIVKKTIQQANWINLEFISVDEDDEFPTNVDYAFVAIGKNEARERLSKLPYKFVNVGRDDYALGNNPEMIGSFFGENSFVGNNSKVGNFCIVNTGAILEHDCELGDYSHLASGAVTGGNVKIGKRTLIGTGAVIRNGITIGDDVVVGAGAVVVDNIPDGQVWFGVPARHQFGINAK